MNRISISPEDDTEDPCIAWFSLRGCELAFSDMDINEARYRPQSIDQHSWHLPWDLPQTQTPDMYWLNSGTNNISFHWHWKWFSFLCREINALIKYIAQWRPTLACFVACLKAKRFILWRLRLVHIILHKQHIHLFLIKPAVKLQGSIRPVSQKVAHPWSRCCSNVSSVQFIVSLFLLNVLSNVWERKKCQ